MTPTLLATTAAVAAAIFSPFASAQGPCGNILTTPPGFVSNNSGGPGGSVYFTLTVDPSITGTVALCEIQLNVSAPNSPDVLANVYQHQATGDWQALTSNGPLLAGPWSFPQPAFGAVSPPESPSTFTLPSAILLNPGDNLIAIQAVDFSHAYTDGDGTNQVASDPPTGTPTLTFSGGVATNAPFTGALFSPRIVNASFRYTVCEGAASATPFGFGCGEQPLCVFEEFIGASNFDLSNTTLEFIPNNGSYTVTVAPGSPFQPTSQILNLGDDEMSTGISTDPRTYEFAGACTQTMWVCSNGYINLQEQGTADFQPTIGKLCAEPARFAPYWADLNPDPNAGGGGTISYELSGLDVIITYDGVFGFSSGVPELTCQVTFLENGRITVNYGNVAGSSDPTLVGFSNGEITNPIIPPADFSSIIPLVVGPASANLELDLFDFQNPIIGRNLQLEL